MLEQRKAHLNQQTDVLLELKTLVTGYDVNRPTELMIIAINK